MGGEGTSNLEKPHTYTKKSMRQAHIIAMALSCDIKNYPFLTGDEFAEACHHLERRYCQATLGPVRKRWKLRSCRALNTTTLTLGTEYNTYVQIIRPLEGISCDGEISDILDKLCLEADPGHAQGQMDMTAQDREMVDAEEADQV